MKVVTEIPEITYILPEDIQERFHIVVAIIHRSKCIMEYTGDPSDKKGGYRFNIIGINNINESHSGYNGNNYPCNTHAREYHKTAKDLVENALRIFKDKIEIEVFKKEDWDLALKWLIDRK